MSPSEEHRGAVRSALSWESVVAPDQAGRDEHNDVADAPSASSVDNLPAQVLYPLASADASEPVIEPEPVSSSMAPKLVEPSLQIPGSESAAELGSGSVAGPLRTPSWMAADDPSEGPNLDFAIAPFDLPDNGSTSVDVVVPAAATAHAPPAVESAGVTAQIPPIPVIGTSIFEDLTAVLPAAVTGPPAVATSRPESSGAPNRASRRADQELVQRPDSVRQSMGPAPATLSPLPYQRSSAGPISLFLTIFVIACVVVGGLVAGRPYLFPREWPEDARWYGDVVERARGVEFTEPVPLVRHAGYTYDVLLADALMGEWQAQLPMWRSLGLASGVIADSTLRQLVTDWTGAFYSADDGGVVIDNSIAASENDGAIVEAMVVAALAQEQHVGGLDRVPFDLDGQALDAAQVAITARNVAAVTPFGAEIPVRRIDDAESLPPVLSYQLNAPLAFAEIVPEVGTEIHLSVSNTMLAPARSPELLEGDRLTQAPTPTSRGFWYMVLARFLEPVEAYAASNALVQSSITVADRDERACTYATFSGGDVVQRAVTADALARWVQAVPVEFDASLTELSNGTTQLVTCDPGVGFDPGGRIGVARELIRWRLVELAALEATGPSLSVTVVDAALQRTREAELAGQLLGEPFDTDPMTMANRARELVRATTVETADPLPQE